MNNIGLLLFVASAVFLVVFGEPVQYRQNQQVPLFRSARQENDPSVNVEYGAPPPSPSVKVEYGAPAPYPPAGQRPDKSLELPNEVINSEELPTLPSEVEIQTTEAPMTTTTDIPTTTEQEEEQPVEAEGRSANGPYPPSGWKPEGTLLVLPLDAQASEDTTTTTLAPESAEPEGRSQPGGPYPPSGWRPPSGQLLLLPIEQQTLAEASPATVNQKDSENNEHDDTEQTTVNSNAKAATNRPLARLETTSEPEAEAVEPRQSNPTPNQPPVVQAGVPGTYFVQLPNARQQQIIYLQPLVVPSALRTPVATSNVQYQQLIQAPNAAARPRAVAYTTQYQSW